MRYTFIFVIICVPAFLWAQRTVTHDQSYWIRLYVQGKINTNWTWQLEADERRFIKPDRQMQFIAHATVQRKLCKSTGIGGGLTFSEVNAVPEWRLFQELNWTKPLGDAVKLSVRFRPEQRFFHLGENNWDQRFRWRYRLQLVYALNQGISIKGSEELMRQNGDFDQNRLYGALNFKISKKVAVEVGYLKIYQKRTEARFFSRDVLRTTFYYFV
jgi:Protein of unknown function (DUF2490)